MAENKGLALVILGIVAIIAIIGLVLLFTKTGTTGQIVTMAGCDSPGTPVLAGPGENPNFLPQWTDAGYACEQTGGIDAYGRTTWCCYAPSNVPVEDRGPVPMQTRPAGVPILG